MKLKIEYVDINSIKPYINNAKEHPQEQIEQIKKSIEQFGMDDPIGIWKDEIVEGHGRLIACKELGMKEVPIIRLDHLSDEERKAYTLAHNKLTMNSDFNFEILENELDSILNIDMSDFGFEDIQPLEYTEKLGGVESSKEKQEVQCPNCRIGVCTIMNYGIPYMGSKNFIAPDIIRKLPKGNRFVDLFGGGFSMSHCALISGKYNKVIYNELNPLLPPLIKKAINGEYNYKVFKPEFITREDFHKNKEKDGYIKYIWSFSNGGKEYMFGKDLENKKQSIHNWVVFNKKDEWFNKYFYDIDKYIKTNDIKARRILWKRYLEIIKKQKNDTKRTQQLERLERLASLQQLQQLEQLERLERM